MVPGSGHADWTWLGQFMARELLWPWPALGLPGSWGGEEGGQTPDLVSLYICSREKGWRNNRHNLRRTQFSCLILSKGPHCSTLAGRLRSNYLCPWTSNNGAFTFWPELDWTGQALAWRQEWTQRKSSTSWGGVRTLFQLALLRRLKMERSQETREVRRHPQVHTAI